MSLNQFAVVFEITLYKKIASAIINYIQESLLYWKRKLQISFCKHKSVKLARDATTYVLHPSGVGFKFLTSVTKFNCAKCYSNVNVYVEMLIQKRSARRFRTNISSIEYSQTSNKLERISEHPFRTVIRSDKVTINICKKCKRTFSGINHKCIRVKTKIRIAPVSPELLLTIRK